MTRTTVAKQIARWEKRLNSLPGTEYKLNALYLYEDAATRKWAREVCDQTERLAGPEALSNTWWKIEDLNHPGVLAGAVTKTLRADLIVVALHAEEGQPLPFYVWVNSWLPVRQPGVGALVALLGASPRPNRQSGRMRKYLRAVAQLAKLDFLLDERAFKGDPQVKIQKKPLTQSLSPWGYEGGGWG